MARLGFGRGHADLTFKETAVGDSELFRLDIPAHN